MCIYCRVASADLCLEKGHFDVLRSRLQACMSTTEDETDPVTAAAAKRQTAEGVSSASAVPKRIYPPPQHSTPTPLKISECE